MFHFVAELESIVQVFVHVADSCRAVSACRRKLPGLGERLVLQTQAGVEVERRCVELLANWRDLV